MTKSKEQVIINDLIAALWAILYADQDNHIPNKLHKQARAAIERARKAKARESA